MKYIVNVIVFLVVALSISACGKVPAGNVGVMVNLYGDDRGVQKEVLGPGWYYVGVYQELYTFPTFTQNVSWMKEDTYQSPGDESLDFSTIEGMNVNADVGISYHVKPEMVSVLFQKYRRGIDEITHQYVRNMVRDELVRVVSKTSVEEIYGSKKTEVMDEVQAVLTKQLEPVGIVIEKVYWIGQLRLPTNVVEALNAKIAATQMAQQRENEIASAKAEAQKKIAEAEGEKQSMILRAEANKVLSSSLTPELVQYKAIEKWDGKLPTTSTGGQAIPFINVK